MKTELQNIRDALRAALDVDFDVRIEQDPALGYVAYARQKLAVRADGTHGKYFFSHGKTEKAAAKNLTTEVEGFFRTRLDMFRTGLNTLLANG